jgi:hypothetical protein
MVVATTCLSIHIRKPPTTGSKHSGAYVKGATTIDDFIAGLKKAHYNTINKKYYIELKDQLAAVIKYKKACGIQ